jgi:hypothetical protein
MKEKQTIEWETYIKFWLWAIQVSNTWLVKTCYKWKEYMRKLRVWNSWYLWTTFKEKGKQKTISLHVLIATCFVSNPNNKPEVNHKNWNKLDNNIENLEWVTHSENLKHRYRVLWHKPVKSHLWKFWKFHPRSIPILQYDLKWIFIKEWENAAFIFKELSIWDVAKVCNGTYKQMNGFIWKYKCNLI